MGYSLNHKGYKRLDSNGKLYISRDVIFDETTFPFAQIDQSSYSIHNSSSLSNSIPSASPLILTVPSQTHSHPISYLCLVATSIDKPINEKDKLTKKSREYSCHDNKKQNGITKPKVYIAAVKEPKIVELALQKNEWKQAMIFEFEALQRNNTWSLVPLPKGRIPIGCRWVYRVKENPDGFVDEKHPEYVCRQHKALYGLKQAPRAWFERLHKALLQSGFVSSKTDQSLFFRITSTHTTYILVYVGDILITGSNAGVVTHIVNGFHLSQQKYIRDLLVKTKMLQAKGLPTPMTSGSKISSQDGVPIENA
ncbi:Retrovirus-related Pol polyprotein from transposon RE2 [Vitis vinifera]|uniref:Retrovirus-related Pol polyprotein from transposon RE2 n=1 Tax=Vitis vinifera TaxID=29760 RepID=A0A438K4K4_VITVI|nr:Retrovirus-related Pol polyprotein from transposon RE2 [Vitis vinifera]